MVIRDNAGGAGFSLVPNSVTFKRIFARSASFAVSFVRRFARKGRKYGPLTVAKYYFLSPSPRVFLSPPFAGDRKLLTRTASILQLRNPNGSYCPSVGAKQQRTGGHGRRYWFQIQSVNRQRPRKPNNSLNHRRERELLLIIVYFRGLESARFPRRRRRLINVRTDGYDFLVSLVSRSKSVGCNLSLSISLERSSLRFPFLFLPRRIETSSRERLLFRNDSLETGRAV